MMNIASERATMARPAGIEPTTHCLEGSCSIQLSYGRKHFKIKDLWIDH
jgi:hypothetical protein